MSIIRQLNKPHSPFLRWVGGKQRLVTELLNVIPEGIRLGTYHEPFVGAASLFAALQPAVACLSDANGPLMAMYEEVRDHPESVFNALVNLGERDCESHYYETRIEYNRGSSSPLQAARFIYLNRTCFNGMFRVNKQGAFNVPYGFLNTPRIPSRSTMCEWSSMLRNSTLEMRSFETVIDRVNSGDLVYLDPPYPPLNETSYFAHYTADRFPEEKQKATATLARRLDQAGCYVVVSNADTPAIRSLYRGWRKRETAVARVVTSKGIARRAKELILTNY